MCADESKQQVVAEFDEALYRDEAVVDAKTQAMLDRRRAVSYLIGLAPWLVGLLLAMGWACVSVYRGMMESGYTH
ncbi:MAG: hypothetical protein KC474_11140 [Cyanobacteria bacterium HKST-UBA04]|nr:hypothetical protein [Cyanobacteria bacterium HKST-UBA04]MCA9840612.1 hypothetical protein [Cyanobacteria bacterium HKST-UBA03]